MFQLCEEAGSCAGTPHWAGGGRSCLPSVEQIVHPAAAQPVSGTGFHINLGPISMGLYNSTIHCLLTMINVGKPWNTHTHTMLSLSTSEWKCLKDQQMCFSFVLTKCVTVFVCYTRTQQPRGQSCKRAGWEQVMKWYWSQFSFYISSFL